MNTRDLISPIDAVRMAGRFSMLAPGPISVDVFGKRQPLLSYESLLVLGLPSMPRIYIDRGDSKNSITPKDLERNSTKDNFGRILNDEARNNDRFWQKFITTDSPVAFIAESYSPVIEKTISSLTSVAVYANHSMTLGKAILDTCAKVIRSNDEVIIVALGAFRQQVNFFGHGTAFESAVTCAMSRPQEFSAYTQSHMSEVKRWKKHVF
jgi:hypothetical protein